MSDTNETNIKPPKKQEDSGQGSSLVDDIKTLLRNDDQQEGYADGKAGLDEKKIEEKADKKKTVEERADYQSGVWEGKNDP